MGKSIEAVKSIIENWKSLQSISICIDEEDLLFDIILSARKSTAQNLKIKYYWDSDDYDTLVCKKMHLSNNKNNSSCKKWNTLQKNRSHNINLYDFFNINMIYFILIIYNKDFLVVL